MAAFDAINGVLLLDKPLGLSSNRVLQKVKSLFNAKKAGHTGSLDPLATGMLPISFGDATKFCQYMLDADKAYTATGVLGKKTTTQDSEGEVVSNKPFEHISQIELLNVLDKFKGAQTQIPSMYSALKKDGVPLYKLARQGIEIERNARDIYIHQLELLAFQPPFFTIRVVCSKGTYIRNLVEDIGDALGAGAYVKTLHRDYVIPFQDDAMYTMDDIGNNENLLALLQPMHRMVSHFPKLKLNDEQTQAIYQGKVLDLDLSDMSSELYQLFDSNGVFLGLSQSIGCNQIKAKRLCARE